MLTIELTPAQEESLNNLAKELGKSKSDLVSQMIDQAIEDAIDIKSADEAMAEHLASGRRAKTLDEVSRELGLDD
jgi:predicted DNA-binding protein